MKIPESLRDGLLERLREFSPGAVDCPVCSGATWTVSDVLYEAREFNRGSMVLGKGQSVLPMVATHCSNCGLTLFLNAIALGLIDGKTGEFVGVPTGETDDQEVPSND